MRLESLLVGMSCGRIRVAGELRDTISYCETVKIGKLLLIVMDKSFKLDL